MSQQRVAVGTTPVIIANVNARRRSMSVTMVPSSIETGNIGRVHIGKGFPPSNVLGAANQGDPLNAGSNITDSENYPDDPTVFKGQWWAVADQANQVITVDEIIADIA